MKITFLGTGAADWNRLEHSTWPGPFTLTMKPSAKKWKDMELIPPSTAMRS